MILASKLAKFGLDQNQQLTLEYDYSSDEIDESNFTFIDEDSSLDSSILVHSSKKDT